MSLKTVSVITGLSVEEIERLGGETFNINIEKKERNQMLNMIKYQISLLYKSKKYKK